MSAKQKYDTRATQQIKVHVNELEKMQVARSRSNHSTKQPQGNTWRSYGGVFDLFGVRGEQARLTLNVIKGLDKTGQCPSVKVWKWQRVRTLCQYSTFLPLNR